MRQHHQPVWQLFRGSVVTDEEIIEGGALLVDPEGTLQFVGRQADLPDFALALPDLSPTETQYLLPGLIDVHCHGGAGVSFPDCASLTDVAKGARAHLQAGTTTLVASLVTATIDELESKAALLAEAAANGIIHAIHFEGPFIDKDRCGAQDPAKIQTLHPENARRLVASANGAAFSMTIAPEQAVTPAGQAGLKELIDGGILPSWGHTSATLPQARQAVQLGADWLGGRPATVTHTFNGMNPMHHREPGPIPEFLAAAKAGQLVLELICDSVHLDPDLVAAMVELLGREAIVFVTDAMAAAGMSDGDYVLGGQRVLVEGGTAYLAKDHCLAGGTSHLIDQVRIASDAGISLVDACYMAATGPARALQVADRGRLAAGLRADFVAVDGELRPLQVWLSGAAVGEL